MFAYSLTDDVESQNARLKPSPISFIFLNSYLKYIFTELQAEYEALTFFANVSRG